MLSRDEEVWMRALEASISSQNLRECSPIDYADKCLEDFKKRFSINIQAKSQQKSNEGKGWVNGV